MTSHPVDRILPPWLANPRNPTMSPHSRHPSHLMKQWKGEKGRGRDAK